MAPEVKNKMGYKESFALKQLTILGDDQYQKVGIKMTLSEKREFYKEEIDKLFNQFKNEDKKNLKTKRDLIELISRAEHQLKEMERQLQNEEFRGGRLDFTYAPDGVSVTTTDDRKITIRRRDFIDDFLKLIEVHDVRELRGITR